MTEKLHDFLYDCSSEMSKNYDNSLNIPEDIRKKYDGKIKIEEEWTSYLKYKFRYLMLSETESEVKANKKISGELTDSGKEYLMEFVPEWKEKAGNERVVCLYRYCQLPKELVEDIWYYQQLQECYDWCKNRRWELDQLDTQAKESKWADKLLKIYGQIGNQPFSDCKQERLLSEIYKEAIGGLIGRVNSVRQYLKETPKILTEITGPAAKNCQHIISQVSECFHCFKDIPSGEVLAETSLLGNDLLAELSLSLIKILHISGFNEMAVITQFLHSLKTNFQCEVCDFLDVTDDNRKVVWKAATVNHIDLSAEYQELSEPELRQKLLQRESYRKGVGISGSILLVNEDIGRNIWYHIGSNDVQHDPRQSEEHRSAYEKDIYPGMLRANEKINNFWMFPIFEGGRLTGAFRVVNKIMDNGQLQPGGWPYFTRVQLALIAQWLSRFMETIRPQLQEAEDYVAIMDRNAKIDEMTTKLNLNWVQKRPLQTLLRHISGDISKRQEKRAVGCCIMIVETSQNEMPLQELGPYPLLDCMPGTIAEPYDGLDAYHDAVNPLMGTYVFNQNGNFIRVARLDCTDQEGRIFSGYQAIEWVTNRYPKTVCLLLPRDTKNILVYQGGEKVAEVHVSETTAKWRFRYPSEILEQMTSWAPNVAPNYLKIICDACNELSYRGYGAIIVVGDIPPDSLNLSTPKARYKSEWKLEDMGKAFFVEFAKMDGATFITLDGYIAKVNRNVTPTKDPELTPLFPGRGNRHEIGEKISKVAPEALVIIVSENRGISIVASGGEKVARDL